MIASLVPEAHKHEWVVFSTVIEDRSLFVQCVDCGAAGTVDDPTRKEWRRAFHAPSRPYRWHGESRVEQRGILPPHVVRAVPCQECRCPNRRRADALYERFPAEIVTPAVSLTDEERDELHVLADVAQEKALCSRNFPHFIRWFQRNKGDLFAPAVIEIACRIETVHRMGLHCSAAVVARVLAEFGNAPPRQRYTGAGCCVADVLPDRDHYWMLHDGEKYALHGTPEKNGVLVMAMMPSSHLELTKWFDLDEVGPRETFNTEI